MYFNFDKRLFWNAAKITLVCMLTAPLVTLVALMMFADSTGASLFKLSVGLGISVLVALIVGFPASYVVLQQGKNLQLANQKLSDLIRFDQLTGLLSRGAFFDEVTRVLDDHRVSCGNSAVFFMDLDHFKQINDQNGHAAGDDVLRVFGSVVAMQLHDGEIAGRLGGEEFALFIPDCNRKEANRRAMQLAKYFAAQKVMTAAGAQIQGTVSIGVYVGSDNHSLDAMLSKADKLLYQAKQNGRNRVFTAENQKIAA